MAGKRSRELELLAERVSDDEQVENKDQKERGELCTWSDAPLELLEIIISRLSLRDNIRASVVCKRWHAAGVSVRVVNQSPWLVFFPKCGNLYEFYDPSQRKLYGIELPELHGSKVCYCKDGWLLLHRGRDLFFFFNPFTREVINLPRINISHLVVAFSCAPTSADCMVFSATHINPTIVCISTYRLGATNWISINYQNRFPFDSSLWDKIVFCSGRFYCLSLSGWLGVFEPLTYSWDVLAVPPPRCPDSFFAKSWWQGKFLAEHKGDLLAVYTCCDENPVVFKLDRALMVWEEVKTLDGLTIFASFLSSYAKADLPNIKRNTVYFTKVRYYGRRCVTYSLDDCRYYPRKQGYDWSVQGPGQNIWIEPPDNVLDLI